MLNRFPIEILYRIFDLLDDEPFQDSPAHHFFYPSPALLPFAQVDHYLRDAIGPLLYSYVSLVRQHEMDTQSSGLYEGAYKRWMRLRYARKYIKELEMPNTMPLSDLNGLENQLTSLIILGGNEYNVEGKVLDFDHLALLLPNEALQVQRIRRLDLLIDSTILNTLSSLESFFQCPIEELNVTTRNFPLLSKSNSFQKFLLALQCTLRKLSYRYTQQRQPSLVFSTFDDDQVSDFNYEFTSVLNQLQLTQLSIDLYLLSSRIFESTRAYDGSGGVKKPLKFTIREPSLAGLVTTEELNRITEFCSNLSSYEIQYIIFAFGVQTEIPYHTSFSILQNLLKFSRNITNGSTKFDPFSQVTQVGSHMIWNIIDDSLFMESSRTKEHPLLSYKTNAHYSPSFRILENFKVVENNDPSKRVQLIRENSEVDYDFWSQEHSSTNLQKFSKYKRSSLWD